MSASDWSTIEQAIQAWIVAGSGLPATQVVWSRQNKGRPSPPAITIAVIADGPVGLDSVTAVAVPLEVDLLPSAIDTTQDTFTAVGHGRGTGDGPFQASSSGSLPGGVAPDTNYWLVVVDADHFRLSPSFLGSIADTPVIVDVTSAGSGVLTIGHTPDTEEHGREIKQTVRGNRKSTLSIQYFAAEGAATGAAGPVQVLRDVGAAASLPGVRQALNDAGVGIGHIGTSRAVSRVINTTVLEPRAALEVDIYTLVELVAYDTYIASADVTPTYDTVQQPTFHVPK